MDLRLKDVLADSAGNYILPFFWQRGEDHAVLREEILKIHQAGIGAVCVEARPHPDFGGPRWWQDMDMIMAEARALDMRVWLLDDAHFPTGFANGKIRDDHPELGKKYLMVKTIDVDGPLENGSFRVGDWLNRFDWLNPQEKLFHDDELFAVVASRRDPLGQGVDDTLVDLTDQVQAGELKWNLPGGPWRIFTLIKTRSYGGDPDYINIIDRDSVRVLIDAVYEPHYARYQADFGQTFAGFFSDEPGFGNTKGFNFDESIGRKKMVLPWSPDALSLLEQEIGPDYKRYLPCLWFEAGSRTSEIRFKYMDIVTRLYAKNFAGQIGAWCQTHGVEYIGHVIEDQNVHARLGCGPGHYFRAVSGQHMAGIDIIGQQVLPRYESFATLPMGTEPDHEFFHFGLAKMGSSLGHIDPKKQGRTMCEIFGASGWASGLKLNKWLIDHALVRGVNHFVPHAFSAKDFPDPDCPPHFYARGRNPQYRYFKHLMTYTNRLCHLLNGGSHIAPVAVLYHGESEWSGDAMYFQKPAHWLSRDQIDHDIIPSDVFTSEQLSEAEGYPLRLEGRQLVINNEKYQALVVPYSQRITASLARFIANAAKSGFTILFIDALPEGICGISDPGETSALLSGIENCPVLTLDRLSATLRELGHYDIALTRPSPYLRYYHYRRGETDFYLFFNEHPAEALETTIHLREQGNFYRYVAFCNKIELMESQPGLNGMDLHIHLACYESALYICGEVDTDLLTPVQLSHPTPAKTGSGEVLQVDGPWRLALATSLAYPEFTQVQDLPVLVDLSRADLFPDFSGTFRYQTVIELTQSQLENSREIVLDLGHVYEIAEVAVNGHSAGVRICPPYQMNVRDDLRPGSNTLEIDVTNTLAHEVHDPMSTTMAIEPSGLIGPVKLLL